jgi:tetratricopeptide (TPR) repeat protein
MKVKPILWSLMLSFLFVLPAWAELKSFTVKVQAFIGDNQTKNDARNLATLEAKRQALEQAGTYIESLTLVKNSVLQKDEILAFTGGVSKTEIISEKTIVSGNSFGLEVTAKVTVDTASVENRIKQYMHNKEALEREKELLSRNQRLEKEMRDYKKQLELLKSSQAVQILRASKGKSIENKLSATEWFEKGYQANGQKRYQEAVKHYSQAIQLDPDYKDAYNNRGIAYYRLGLHPQAIADYTKLIGMDPHYILAYSNRGIVYYGLKQYPQALADYNQAIRLDPRYAMAYSNRGALYQIQGQLTQALADYNKALSLDPNEITTYINRGKTYRSLKQYAQALADYNKAISLDPQYAKVYNSRGNVYYELEQYPQALADFNKAISLDLTYAQAYTNRGLVYHAQAKYPQASADWKKACELGLKGSCGF